MNYTPKQLQILRLISEYQTRHKYSPTYAELARELNVSTITVFEHLEALERKGAIKRRRHEARSVELVEPMFVTHRTIPVRAFFTPGRPLERAPSSDTAPVGELFGPVGLLFALRVRGSDLRPLGILDGDLLILESRDSAPSESWVVALQREGLATLCRCAKRKGSSCLIALSGKSKPLPLKQADLQGVVRGLIRSYQ
jgi:repressor LexA